MSQIEEVNEIILSKILKTGEFYEALWGKEDFTPNVTINTPNDYNCGAICNALEYVYQFVRDITGTSLADLGNPYLDIVVYFFTGIKRYSGEADEYLLNRMNSLLIREDEWRSDRLGTPWDIKNVFSYYVPRELVYVINNTVLTNLMLNGDFESAVSSEWLLSPSGDRSLEDSFVGSYKIDMSLIDTITQTISVTTGAYVLNAFINPTGSVNIDVFDMIIQRNSDSYYYNLTTRTWDIAKPSNIHKALGGEWSLYEAFLIVDGSYDIDITFSKENTFLLDRIEFGEKEYPCFEILVIEAFTSPGYMSLWGDTVDKTNASFLDQDFMFSSSISNYSDVYFQNLLDIIKSAGVRGLFIREERT